MPFGGCAVRIIIPSDGTAETGGFLLNLRLLLAGTKAIAQKLPKSLVLVYLCKSLVRIVKYIRTLSSHDLREQLRTCAICAWILVRNILVTNLRATVP